MTAERAETTDGEANSETGPTTDADAGHLHRAWQRLVAAGRWIADTFRGHSGAGQLKNRKK